MILVIDNYDSFTYNLVQYLGELGADVQVRRNNQVTVGEIEAMAPAQHSDLAGAGPARRTPASRPTSSARSARRRRCSASASAIRRSAWSTAGTVGRAATPMHGKTSTVVHDGKGVFSRHPRAVPRRPLPLAGDHAGRRAAGARGRGAHAGGRHDHGRPSPHAPGPRRAVPPRVGADGGGTEDSAELPGSVMLPAAHREGRPQRGPERRRGRRGDARGARGARWRPRPWPACSSRWSMKGERPAEIVGFARDDARARGQAVGARRRRVRHLRHRR